MKFKSLSLNNVFSIGRIFIDLDNQGIQLITGFSYDEGHSNGSGKSSLINKGLVWTLFGQTPGGLKGDDVINRWGHSEASGVVAMEKNGVLYTIHRIRQKGKSELRFHRREENVGKKDIKGTQELINEFLGRDLKSFCNTEFFGQGNKIPFFSMTGREQKELLETILPIEQINDWIDKAKNAKKITSSKLTEITRNMNYVNAKKDVLQADYMRSIERHSEWHSKHKKDIATIQSKIKDLESSKDAIRIREIEKELKDKPASLESKIKSTTQSLSITNGFISECNRDLNDANESRVELERYLSMVKRGECPTCEQAWPIDENRLSQLNEALSNIKLKTQTLNAQLNEHNEARVISTEELKKLEKLYAHYYSLEQELGKLQENDIKQKLTELKVEERSLHKLTSPYIERVNSLSEEIKVNSEKYQKIKKELDIINNEVKIIDFWIKTYDVTLRNAMFDKVCPYLEHRINKHLRGLSNAQIKVSVSTNKVLKSGDSKNEFVASAKSETGGNTYDSLSGGEQQMVDFATGLALANLADSQVSGSSNILVLDEPFVALDEKNCENIVNYLNIFPKSSIFLVSNEESLKGLIPNRLHVEKKNGISTLAL